MLKLFIVLWLLSLMSCAECGFVGGPGFYSGQPYQNGYSRGHYGPYYQGLFPYHAPLYAQPGAFYNQYTNSFGPLPGGGVPVLVDHKKRCSGNYVGVQSHPDQRQYYYVCNPDGVVFSKCGNLQTFDSSAGKCTNYNNGQTAFTCKKEGNYAIRGDCTIYYKCDCTLTPRIYSCPRGKIFSTTTKECVAGNQCPPTQVDSASDQIPDNWEHKFPSCQENGKFRSPSDCSIYFICSLQSNGTFLQTRFKCPNENYYDIEKDACLPQSEVACDCVQIAELVYHNPNYNNYPAAPYYSNLYPAHSLMKYPVEESQSCEHNNTSVEQYEESDDSNEPPQSTDLSTEKNVARVIPKEATTMSANTKSVTTSNVESTPTSERVPTSENTITTVETSTKSQTSTVTENSSTTNDRISTTEISSKPVDETTIVSEKTSTKRDENTSTTDDIPKTTNETVTTSKDASTSPNDSTIVTSTTTDKSTTASDNTSAPNEEATLTTENDSTVNEENVTTPDENLTTDDETSATTINTPLTNDDVTTVKNDDDGNVAEVKADAVTVADKKDNTAKSHITQTLPTTSQSHNTHTTLDYEYYEDTTKLSTDLSTSPSTPTTIKHHSTTKLTTQNASMDDTTKFISTTLNSSLVSPSTKPLQTTSRSNPVATTVDSEEEYYDDASPISTTISSTLQTSLATSDPNSLTFQSESSEEEIKVLSDNIDLDGNETTSTPTTPKSIADLPSVTKNNTDFNDGSTKSTLRTFSESLTTPKLSTTSPFTTITSTTLETTTNSLSTTGNDIDYYDEYNDDSTISTLQTSSDLVTSKSPTMLQSSTFSPSTITTSISPVSVSNSPLTNKNDDDSIISSLRSSLVLPSTTPEPITDSPSITKNDHNSTMSTLSTFSGLQSSNSTQHSVSTTESSTTLKSFNTSLSATTTSTTIGLITDLPATTETDDEYYDDSTMSTLSTSLDSRSTKQFQTTSRSTPVATTVDSEEEYYDDAIPISTTISSTLQTSLATSDPNSLPFQSESSEEEIKVLSDNIDLDGNETTSTPTTPKPMAEIPSTTKNNTDFSDGSTKSTLLTFSESPITPKLSSASPFTTIIAKTFDTTTDSLLTTESDDSTITQLGISSDLPPSNININGDSTTKASKTFESSFTSSSTTQETTTDSSTENDDYSYDDLAISTLSTFSESSSSKSPKILKSSTTLSSTTTTNSPSTTENYDDYYDDSTITTLQTSSDLPSLKSSTTLKSSSISPSTTTTSTTSEPITTSLLSTTENNDDSTISPLKTSSDLSSLKPTEHSALTSKALTTFTFSTTPPSTTTTLITDAPSTTENYDEYYDDSTMSTLNTFLVSSSTNPLQTTITSSSDDTSSISTSMDPNSLPFENESSEDEIKVLSDNIDLDTVETTTQNSKILNLNTTIIVKTDTTPTHGMHTTATPTLSLQQTNTNKTLIAQYNDKEIEINVHNGQIQIRSNNLTKNPVNNTISNSVDEEVHCHTSSRPRLEIDVKDDVDLLIRFCPSDCDEKHEHSFEPKNRAVDMKWFPNESHKTFGLETGN